MLALVIQAIESCTALQLGEITDAPRSMAAFSRCARSVEDRACTADDERVRLVDDTDGIQCRGRADVAGRAMGGWRRLADHRGSIVADFDRESGNGIRIEPVEQFRTSGCPISHSSDERHTDQDLPHCCQA